jgi:hypothetical protein
LVWESERWGAILYTSQMSFLDGYDPMSDEIKVHIVPDAIK